MGIVMYNGISSLDYGIQVEHPPEYRIPSRDYETIHIPGRNGDLVIDNGSYQNVNRSYKLAVGDRYKYFTEMAGGLSDWLHSASGYARLEDSYEPEYYRMAIFHNDVEIENILEHAGRVTVDFNCDLLAGRFIVTRPNPYDNPQPFRIYYISKPFNGLITVKAQHISYDMSGYPVASIHRCNRVEEFLSAVQESVLTDSPFVLNVDIDTKVGPNGENTNNGLGSLKTDTPQSERSVLNLLITHNDDKNYPFVFHNSLSGPEYRFDVFDVTLCENRGENRGISIKYGKNLTDISQEEDISKMYTAVYPFFYNDEWGFFDITTAVSGTGYEDRFVPVAPESVYLYEKIYILDVTNEWENNYGFVDAYPSSDEIKNLADDFIVRNKELGVPKLSLTVSFEDLSKSDEYERLKIVEEVRLCDLVTVEFPKLNIRTTLKCVKTTYDAIMGKYISIDLGDPKSDLPTMLSG